MSEFVDVYLGLGSNVGDRISNLNKGIELLAMSFGINVLEVSEFVNSKPISNVQQADYLNGVLYISTSLGPFELLEITQAIEKKCGRLTKSDHQPRPLDLDILLYGSTIISESELTIPHPLMHERHFVLKPFSDIASDVEHPVLNQSISHLLNSLEGY